jgi:hypothetical protein
MPTKESNPVAGAKLTPLDNLTWRAEFVDDFLGQRTGTKTR